LSAAAVPLAEGLAQRLDRAGADTLRVSWADLHGSYRTKTLIVRPEVIAALERSGIGMVSTVLLKDSADRTAVPVFEAGGAALLPGFSGANNLVLKPDPDSLLMLPWAPRTAWLRAEPFWPDGREVAVDPRRALQAALAALRATGHGLRCGLEVELHVYRLAPGAEPARAADDAWPAEPPALYALHPGHALLGEVWADRCDEVFGIVRHTCAGLGLPLRSLEVEFGPSQIEAVFDATDALTAADQLLLLRSALRQALRRAGYHASFVCKPPLAGAMASGWHLHQSLVDAQGHNAMRSDEGLSAVGRHWLAGLLAHAPALAALCAPTPNAYARYAGSPMAPQAAVWGRDNRGAMLRVVGEPGDAGTRIENRLGEPLANPYLAIAAQVWAGLDGLARRLEPGPATETPYADASPAALPRDLGSALDALAADRVLRQGLGEPLWLLFDRVKRQELARRAASADVVQWDRREYLGRF
jgi:glutamine synthetase